MADSLSELKVEVAVLRQEITFINRLFERLEGVIDTIDEQHDTLLTKTTETNTNLVNTKEELSDLYDTLKKTETDFTTKINNLEHNLRSHINAINANLSTRIEKVETNSNDFTKSKWILFGGAGVVLWLFSNIELVKKIFFIK